ncbi:MAG: methionine biosynthesis protein MetW [Hahellaceae bacterium]|nr:methionine biosynthesis protein MetW [Hahellaceae bacterium]MCP5168418.1 methionine biosynthesis protein MetW [Hahellaceae bacterium]
MRADLELIEQWIKPASRLLDLGCGDGTLLHHLSQTKQINGYGLEINPDHINACISKGVNVIEQDLDVKGLANFKTNGFDYVIMTQALQAVMHPDRMLDEMLRLGKECIITFPNFGHWKCRWYLMNKGEMPISRSLPYTWYNTPNIHLCTFKDFENLCRQRNLQIINRTVVDRSHQHRWFIHMWPNMLGEIAIYHLSR